MSVPLLRITYSMLKFKWNKIEQDTFDEIKWIVEHNILLAYLYFNG